MFEIWLVPVGLIGCDDSGALLLASPAETRSWVVDRYAAALERIGRSHGRSARLATDRELQLLDALLDAGAEKPADVPLPHDHQEAV
jgi:hypothetical protein